MATEFFKNYQYSLTWIPQEFWPKFQLEHQLASPYHVYQLKPLKNSSKLTCAAVEGESKALDEYRRLAAKALEWRRIGNPTPKGVPGALPGEDIAEPKEPIQPELLLIFKIEL